MRARVGALGVFCLVGWCGAYAQTVISPAPQGVSQAPLDAIQVHEGDVIPLRLLDTLSSNESKPGQVLHLEATDDVVSGGRVLVRRGAPATAEVVRADQHRKIAMGGRVSLKLNDIELADGSHLPLDTVYGKGGGGLSRKTFKTVAIVSAVLLSPSGTAFLLLSHGEEVTIPAGTNIEAHVASDGNVEGNKFAAADGKSPASKPPKDSKTLDKLSVETETGDGSVFVDEAYMGEAPITLELKPGVYKIRIFRDGYRAWKEHVAVDGDGLKLKVALQKR